MIGVFDSGIGGLTVLQWIRQRLPQADLLYLADQAFAPYGAKSSALLQQRCDCIADWLIAQGCTALVVACNTATAHCVDALRDRLAIDIIGVEPGIKPAALGTRSGAIGILATENTLASSRYQQLASRFNPNTRVVNQPCSGLADAIEQGPDSPQIDTILARCTTAMTAAGVDRVVLGCTHYPLVKDRLQGLLGTRVQLIDTGEAIAGEVARRAGAAALGQGTTRLLTTGSLARLKQLISAYPQLCTHFQASQCEAAPPLTSKAQTSGSSSA
ncbi:glutamate racemase [Saccharospirillum impatiens]|uniref:glutamate racemase n=1 Tax=Saccharospirillum impatiens TaxID=169438 RepID=UPI000421B7E4|nr:glutamate racemase [Saccharospirillum impatiens]